MASGATGVADVTDDEDEDTTVADNDAHGATDAGATGRVPDPLDDSARPQPRARTAGGSLHWWGELTIVLAFYGVYTFIRNQFGSDLGPSVKQAAIDNAYDVIAWERAVHLFGEKGIQDLFIEWDQFIRFWNIFYGLCHFAVTVSVMVFLFWRHPVRYGVQRTVLAFTTALALVGFALYPLMPPRLLNDCSAFGACDSNYSYVDTLVDPGGFWSFNSSAMMDISNQYAAMPSLHVAWAVWCVVAALPVLRRRWVRLGLLAYPWLTLFAVMVTANHFWLDAVGGLLAVAVAYPAGVLLARRLPAWLAPRPAGAVGP